MRMVQNEILDMHELACHPERAGGIEEMAAFGKPLTDHRAQYPLVQPRHRILRRGKGWKQGLKHRTVDIVAHC